MRATRHAKTLPTELLTLIFMPAALMYLEKIFRIYFLSKLSSGFFNFLGRYFGAGLWLSLLFAAAMGVFFTLLCTFFNKRVNRYISLGLLGFMTFFFCAQIIYVECFGSVLKLTLAADTGGAALLEFAGVTIRTTLKMLWLVIIEAVPFILLLVFGKDRHLDRSPVFSKRNVPLAIALSIATFGVYAIYWKYRTIQNVKVLRKEMTPSEGETALLVLLPFYCFFWWYTRGKYVKDEFRKRGKSAIGNEFVYLALSFSVFSLVSLAIMQNDFNSLSPADLPAAPEPQQLNAEAGESRLSRRLRGNRERKPHSRFWHFLFDRPIINYVKYPIPAKVVLAVALIILHLIPWSIIMMTDKTSGLRGQYTTAFEYDTAAEKFGMMTTSRREIQLALGKALDIGGDVEILDEGDDAEEPQEDEPQEDEPVVYGANVMDIDFDSLIANETDSTYKKMHEYFANRTPTKKNEYTGLFQGYNLVMITAEGFSPYCISKELTPTLYKMQTEGFRFTNFYASGYDDTTTGEFVHTTGLIPGGYANNLKKIKNNYMPFTMGTQFQKLGVRTYAYHPHTYTYYGRNETHPNLGYDVYRGRGGGVVDGKESSKYGLELEHPRYWPESDLEAVQASASEYIGKNDGKPFHAYYMSVSGHKDYSFSDNMMSYKNREVVRDLPYCETNKAYIAANIELDRAMEWLMEELEKTGQLDKTLFCITPDHKPQMLTNEQVEEMAGRKLDSEFEIYRGVFLLYCAGYHDAPEITAPANSIDIIPTVSNLLGLEYDSRLLFGRDLLDSSAQQLITFRTRSWISDKGRYNFRTKTFTPDPDADFSGETQDEYVARINNIVSNKFKMSDLVITKDYYRRVFKKK